MEHLLPLLPATAGLGGLPPPPPLPARPFRPPIVADSTPPLSLATPPPPAAAAEEPAEPPCLLVEELGPEVEGLAAAVGAGPLDDEESLVVLPRDEEDRGGVPAAADAPVGTACEGVVEADGERGGDNNVRGG